MERIIRKPRCYSRKRTQRGTDIHVESGHERRKGDCRNGEHQLQRLPHPQDMDAGEERAHAHDDGD